MRKSLKSLRRIWVWQAVECSAYWENALDDFGKCSTVCSGKLNLPLVFIFLDSQLQHCHDAPLDPDSALTWRYLSSEALEEVYLLAQMSMSSSSRLEVPRASQKAAQHIWVPQTLLSPQPGRCHTSSMPPVSQSHLHWALQDLLGAPASLHLQSTYSPPGQPLQPFLRLLTSFQMVSRTESSNW